MFRLGQPGRGPCGGSGFAPSVDQTHSCPRRAGSAVGSPHPSPTSLNPPAEHHSPHPGPFARAVVTDLGRNQNPLAGGFGDADRGCVRGNGCDGSTRALRRCWCEGELRWPQRMRQNQSVPSPCSQMEQLRAELLQERSSRQDLECDKVSLERQVRLSHGGHGTAEGTPQGRKAKHLGPAPLLPRASLRKGLCSQGAFPAVKPFPVL